MKNDLRLIEAGFPCHQVGAETQRERGASSALPPLYFLHVWWARWPLTPSRAAILASLLPADTDPDWFLKQLGIEKTVVEINGQQWTLTGKILDKIEINEHGEEVLVVDDRVLELLRKENERRKKNREIISQLQEKDRSYDNNIILKTFEKESSHIPDNVIKKGFEFSIKKVPADPWWFKQLMALSASHTPPAKPEA